MAGVATGVGRTLGEVLGEVPDRRDKKGRQYPWRAVLVLALSAMLSGANDLMAIFRWGRRLPPEALYLLGLERAPCHAMYHYFFQALDVAAEPVLGAWVRDHGPLGHVAMDGKRLRGSTAAGHDGSQGVHLLAAFASRLGAVIGQLQVPPEANEITAALTLLKGLLTVSREVVPALDWPGAVQVCRIERTRESKGKISREIVYAITSLSCEQAGPEALLALVRDHWSIENRLHWRRDVLLGEDASRIRSGAAPQAMAILRNTMLAIANRLAGPIPAIRQAFAENRCAASATVKNGSL